MGIMTTLRLNELTARQNRSMLARLMADLKEARMRRAARHALLKLDDRMLKDMGLTRGAVMSDHF